MAGISFLGYEVIESFYKRNMNFKGNSDDKLNPAMGFVCEITENKETGQVILTIVLGEDKTTGKEFPFDAQVKIRGNFLYHEEESENISFEEFLRSNAIAILFPYLRMHISNLTLMSNEFQALNLPVINVVHFLEDTESIQYSKID